MSRRWAECGPVRGRLVPATAAFGAGGPAPVRDGMAMVSGFDGAAAGAGAAGAPAAVFGAGAAGPAVSPVDIVAGGVGAGLAAGGAGLAAGGAGLAAGGAGLAAGGAGAGAGMGPAA